MAKCSGRIGHVYRTAKFELDHLLSSKWAAGGKIVEDIFRRVAPLHYDDVPFAYDESDMRARPPFSMGMLVLSALREDYAVSRGNSIRRLGSKPRRNWMEFDIQCPMIFLEEGREEQIEARCREICLIRHPDTSGFPTKHRRPPPPIMS